MASSSYSSEYQSVVAEGLWQLADESEKAGDVPATVRFLEAICQSERPFLPLIEIKTRVRLANYLFEHTNNIAQARSHLERTQLLLKNVPGDLDLKCRVLSLLSHCYQALDSKNLRKQVLQKGSDLLLQAQDWEGSALWLCNFQMQMIGASLQEGDPETAMSCASTGLQQAQRIGHAPLQLLFAATTLHVRMCTSLKPPGLAEAAALCDRAWEVMGESEKEAYAGLSVYHRLLRAAHWLSLAEYANAKVHLEGLDATLEAIRARQPAQDVGRNTANGHAPTNPSTSNGAGPASTTAASREVIDLEEFSGDADASNGAGPSSEADAQADRPGRGGVDPGKTLPLGPPPLDSEWLPLTAAEGLAALMWALHERPAGPLKKCLERLRTALSAARAALQAAGITPSSTATSVTVQTFWDAHPYLVLLQHLLDAKAGIELTQCDVKEAQTTIAEAVDSFERFPTHEALRSTIQILIGQYATTVGDSRTAIKHFQVAASATEDTDAKAHIAVQTALAHLSANTNADRSAAVDMVTPLVHENELPRLRVRAQAAALFASSKLLAIQGEHLQARFQIGRGLKVTHKQLSNHQLVSQFLAMLGSVNRALNDLPVAEDVLRSAFTLAKSQRDLVTQVVALEEGANVARLKTNQVQLDETTAQLQRRRADLQGRIQAALRNPLHAVLMQYGLNAQD